MTRVLIATASEITRSWFGAFPAHADGISIIGIAMLDGDLPARVHELAPDVLVLDAAGADGETFAQTIESIDDPGIDIVALRDGEAWPANQSGPTPGGVRAVLSRRPTLQELEAVIGAVVAGFVVVDPSSLPAAMTTTANELTVPPLTPREIDVLNALAEGLGNKQIAVRLAISEHTVKTHLASIFEKLDASNRTEAVIAGARLGLLLM